jgi:hypothetical protein
MEERDDDTAREAVEARRFADPTLNELVEALRVQRDAYAASGEKAAVIYDKSRDELVVAKQRLSDQEKELAARISHERLDELTRPANIHNISHDEGAPARAQKEMAGGAAGEVTIDGIPLDEAEQLGAIPAAEPSTVS